MAEPEWIKWAGGDCPVPADTLVDVRIGAIGEPIEETDCAENWLWKHTLDAVNGDYHIVAYRVVQP